MYTLALARRFFGNQRDIPLKYESVSGFTLPRTCGSNNHFYPINKKVFGRMIGNCAVCYELVGFQEHGEDTTSLLLTITGPKNAAESLLEEMFHKKSVQEGEIYEDSERWRVPSKNFLLDLKERAYLPVTKLTGENNGPMALFRRYHDTAEAIESLTPPIALP